MVVVVVVVVVVVMAAEIGFNKSIALCRFDNPCTNFTSVGNKKRLQPLHLLHLD